jgi:hypothetical protein
MYFRGIWAALLLNAAPLLAAPVQPLQAARAGEVRLRAWLAANPELQAKLARAVASSFVEPDLKDAVADRPVESSRLGDDARQPGLKAPPQPDCRDFQGCAVPPLAMDVPPGEPVEPAILAMMKPWIWLADAEGMRLGVDHADAESQALLSMNIQGLDLTGVGLNVAPRPEGGVHLWFSRGFELAFAYSRERDRIVGGAARNR